MGTVRELSAGLDASTVLEVYGVESGKPLEHLGTYNLDNEAHLNTLMEQYGGHEVIKEDRYKGYTLLYVRLG